MLITIDFETYYDKEYSLSKLTTEDYIRDKKFEVIGVGLKVNDEETEWFSGGREETKEWLSQFDWDNAFVLAHNNMFDGAILSWYFNIHPKVLFDTLCMARAINGVYSSVSLANLSKQYGLGEKGTEVLDALGKRRSDFSPSELERYGGYCRNDVYLTYKLFEKLYSVFPRSELKIIDITLKMFTEPRLQLDVKLLEDHLNSTKIRKAELLKDSNTCKDVLMSNDKFARILEEKGIIPPKKISLRTGKETWAFAKTDEEFAKLADHENEEVRTLVAARLGNKSTLEETRTERFIDISNRGLMPVPLKYYAAHTGRWGGDDKINMQNLPSRGQSANKLKTSIKPLDNYILVDADSSQIEARVLAWLSEQYDLVDAFENGEDVYKIMASQIYNKDVDLITKDERFVGKTTILGCGYGMGSIRFQDQLRTFGVDIDINESTHIVEVYRKTYSNISRLWKQGHKCINSMVDFTANVLGKEGVLQFDPQYKGFLLPNGLWQQYVGLRKVYDADGRPQFEYKTRNSYTKIYGGKLIENICQALARCIIAEQMLKISKKYKVVLTVHDAITCVVPEKEIDIAVQFVRDSMKWRPTWCKDLPLDCEVVFGLSYGDIK